MKENMKRTHTYLWLNHYAVYQKLAQHHKLIIPQLNKNSTETLKQQCWSTFRLVNTSMYQEGGAPQDHGDRSSCIQESFTPCPVYLFIWLFTCIFYNSLYNKLANISKCFSKFCEPSSQINWKQKGGHGIHWLIASWSEAEITIWTCNWHVTCG